jgi:Txe/YoeB family toxin of toxin-antitoxin system
MTDNIFKCPNYLVFCYFLRKNPFENPPSYEKLVGNLRGCYSRRINIKHRLVYRVIKETKTVEILRMWSHYE